MEGFLLGCRYLTWKGWARIGPCDETWVGRKGFFLTPWDSDGRPPEFSGGFSQQGNHMCQGGRDWGDASAQSGRLWMGAAGATNGPVGGQRWCFQAAVLKRIKPRRRVAGVVGIRVADWEWDSNLFWETLFWVSFCSWVCPTSLIDFHLSILIGEREGVGVGGQMFFPCK